MTWKEIKQAIEDAGIEDYEEISSIECENGSGDHTLHRIKIGRFVKFRENVSPAEQQQDSEGCAI